MKFEGMIGKTIVDIRGLYTYSEEIIFTCSDNNQYKMWHEKRCCDDAYLYSVIEDKDCLRDEPIISAEYFEEDGTQDDCVYYNTPKVVWMYYTLSTKRGKVALKWVGTWHGTSYCKPYVEFE